MGRAASVESWAVKQQIGEERAAGVKTEGDGLLRCCWTRGPWVFGGLGGRWASTWQLAVAECGN